MHLHWCSTLDYILTANMTVDVELIFRFMYIIWDYL